MVINFLNKTSSRVRTRQYLSDIFPIQNDPKLGDLLSQAILPFALKYVVWL